MRNFGSLADMVPMPPKADAVARQIPSEWFIVFHGSTRRPWLRWLPFGRFKHVSCFGWVEAAQMWVFFDPALERTWLRLVPDDVASAEPAHIFDIKAGYYGGDIGYYSTVGVVVRLDTQTDRLMAPNIRPGRGCVRDVARLVGVRTWAMLPDTFFRKCIQLGGQIINPERMPR